MSNGQANTKGLQENKPETQQELMSQKEAILFSQAYINDVEKILKNKNENKVGETSSTIKTIKSIINKGE